MKSYAAQSDITAINLASQSISPESCKKETCNYATNHLTSKRALSPNCLAVSGYTTLIDDLSGLKLNFNDTLMFAGQVGLGG